MNVSFLTPPGILFALSAALPLAVFVLRARRGREIGRTLGLAEPPLRSYAPLVAALAAVPALLGVAAMQPVLETTRTVRQRTDVQAFVVMDVSRSMLASRAVGTPTRLARARGIAAEVRGALPEVPFGIVSMTDRVLPHLFPTGDASVFDAALDRVVRVDNPPPSIVYSSLATNLGSLREIPGKNYFPPSAKRRVLVVLTDGESEEPGPDLAAAFERTPRIRTVFVHVRGENEAIYETGVAEGGYSPDPRAGATLARAAELTGGEVVDEGRPEAVVDAVRRAVGVGETAARTESSGRIALMPWVTLLALVPLLVLLLRRNLWWSGRPALARVRRRRTERAEREAAKVPAPRGVAQPG